MTKFKNMIGMGIAALAVISMPAMAATPATAAKPAVAHAARPATVARTAAIAKPATVARAAPVRAAPATLPKARVAAAHPHGRMVRTRLSNGKVVTYNCSLPGNAAKAACKG